MKCPNCAGTVKVLSQTAMFCLDCDWDNLEERDFSRKTRPVDVEWYTKMQLREYQRWKEGDFLRVQPDWIGGYRYNNRRCKWLPNVLFPSFHRRGTRSDTTISGAGKSLAETATSRAGR